MDDVDDVRRNSRRRTPTRSVVATVVEDAMVNMMMILTSRRQVVGIIRASVCVASVCDGSLVEWKSTPENDDEL